MGTTSDKGPAPGADHRTFLFGAFVLDEDRGALLKDGVDIPLRPKSFKVLCHLVEHHGLLVTKEELLGAVWADVVVTEDSLTQCLIEIRKALGDVSRNMVRAAPRLPVRCSGHGSQAWRRSSGAGGARLPRQPPPTLSLVGGRSHRPGAGYCCDLAEYGNAGS